MSDSRMFALICWLVWAVVVVAALVGAMPWPLTVTLIVSVYVLWRMYRRAAVIHA